MVLCAVNVDPRLATYDKWGYCVLEESDDFEDFKSLKKLEKNKIVKLKTSRIGIC